MKAPVLGLALALAVPAVAAAQAPDARAIFERAQKRHLLGFDDAKLVFTLVVKNPKGEKRERRIVSHSRREGGALRQHVCFLSPAELENTAFVSIQRSGARDDQYLWLPGQGRLRRVPPGQRKGRFLGTDFSYRDLEERKADDGQHVLLREERLGGFDAWVIETTPKPGVEDEYGKVVTWIRKRDDFPLRTKLYDRGGRHVKTLFVREIGRTAGRLYAKRVRMADVVNRRSTYLEVETLDVGTRAPDELFDPAWLARGQACRP